jgi:hypothetical protein
VKEKLWAQAEVLSNLPRFRRALAASRRARWTGRPTRRAARESKKSENSRPHSRE